MMITVFLFLFLFKLSSKTDYQFAVISPTYCKHHFPKTNKKNQKPKLVLLNLLSLKILCDISFSLLKKYCIFTGQLYIHLYELGVAIKINEKICQIFHWVVCFSTNCLVGFFIQYKGGICFSPQTASYEHYPPSLLSFSFNRYSSSTYLSTGSNLNLNSVTMTILVYLVC